jgi:hypothetical protein
MKKIILIIILIIVSLIIYQNKPMAILRTSSATSQRTTETANTYTISAYDPGYAGTEKGRIIFVNFRTNASAGGGAIYFAPGGSGSITYGGVNMRFCGGSSIIGAQANGSSVMYYIINPPTGAQDIVFSSIGGNFAIMVNIVAYYSDSDYSFRVIKYVNSITSGTSATTTITTTYANSWSIGFSNNASRTTTNTQTITSGTSVTSVGGTALLTVDSNGVVADGAATGVGTSMTTSASIYQTACTFAPIRRAMFWFLDL